jgi:hypothetical protein
MPSANGKTKLNTDIPADLKERFQIHCLLKKTTMTDVVTELIRSYLDNQTEGKEVG